MTLHQLIQSISVETPRASAIKEAAAHLSLTTDALFIAVARDVAHGYLSGKYSWEFGDMVMNRVYSCAYVFSDLCLPDFARHVFEAFDEGEYVHEGTAPEQDGEPRTKALLKALLDNPV